MTGKYDLRVKGAESDSGEKGVDFLFFEFH